MGSSKQSTTATQTQNQSGTIDPWQPSQQSLNGILGGINSLVPNYAPNAAQSSAIGQINNNVLSAPNMAPQAAALTNSLASGGPNYQPIVSDAYSQYQKALTPILQGNLDPTQTPGIQNALSTIQNDVSNNVNGMFAGAGRDLSGLNQQSLARGIAQGEAPVLLGQYNQNVANVQNAGAGLLGGAQNTASTLSGLQQTQYGNQINGITNAGNYATASPVSTLQAANTAYGAPIQNLAQLEALTVPIAGLGKQYSGVANGTSQSDTTSTPSVLQDIMGVGSLFAGGGSSAASGMAGAGLGLLALSDPDLKTDAREVGELHDGQKIYSYRFKGSPTTQIGLMADQVADNVPDAVGILGGYRAVDYKKATDKAAKMARK